MIEYTDILEASKWLENQAALENIGLTQEVLYRTSVSRAYYSAFHALEQVANMCPAVGSEVKGGVHWEVIQKLLNCPLDGKSFPRKTAKDIRRVGAWLQKLRTERVRSDYLLADDVSNDTVVESLKLANKIARNKEAIMNSVGVTKAV